MQQWGGRIQTITIIFEKTCYDNKKYQWNLTQFLLLNTLQNPIHSNIGGLEVAPSFLYSRKVHFFHCFFFNIDDPISPEILGENVWIILKNIDRVFVLCTPLGLVCGSPFFFGEEWRNKFFQLRTIFLSKIYAPARHTINSAYILNWICNKSKIYKKKISNNQLTIIYQGPELIAVNSFSLIFA